LSPENLTKPSDAHTQLGQVHSEQDTKKESSGTHSYDFGRYHEVIREQAAQARYSVQSENTL
jgi:hypothetical protein